MQPAASQKRDIQRVTTGQELQQAVFDGVKHIIISRHLDMGQDPLWDRQFGSIFPSVPKKSMLSVANGTQTITVRRKEDSHANNNCVGQARKGAALH